MGRAKWPALPLFRAEMPVQRLQRGRFQRLGLVQRRQQAAKAHGQHGLAGPRRTDQQDAVIAGRRHLQRALGLVLSLDVGKVRVGRRRAGQRRAMPEQS